MDAGRPAAAARRRGRLEAERGRDNSEKGDSPHLPERPGGCFAQMGTAPFAAAQRAAHPRRLLRLRGSLQETFVESLAAQQHVVFDPMHGSWAGKARRYLHAVFPQCFFSTIRDTVDAQFNGRVPDCTRRRIERVVRGRVSRAGPPRHRLRRRRRPHRAGGQRRRDAQR